VDAAQTPNNKTKVATVKFLTDLAATFCTAAQFPTQPPAEKAIQKIVQYATDQKSIDLRSHSRSCLIALYNCNTPNVSDLEFDEYV
jgi:CLIP-associating protein 1/2